jgi:hypothetical protein
MSDAAREMETALIDSLDAQFVSGIAASRTLTPRRARRDRRRAGRARRAREARLDRRHAALRRGDRARGRRPEVEESDYSRVDPASVGFTPVAKFALVYGSGMVTSGEGNARRAARRARVGDRVEGARGRRGRSRDLRDRVPDRQPGRIRARRRRGLERARSARARRASR